MTTILTTTPAENGEDVLRLKSGDLVPVQWKGYMSGVHAYQGEVLDKVGANERIDVKLKLAERDRSNLANQDWHGLMLIIDYIITQLSTL
jgi:hypothetical protein